MENKISGIIKWYDSGKKEGYIIGIDGEKYYFDQLSLESSELNYIKGDEVLFMPIFESEIPYAEKVEIKEE